MGRELTELFFYDVAADTLRPVALAERVNELLRKRSLEDSMACDHTEQDNNQPDNGQGDTAGLASSDHSLPLK